MKRLAVVSLVVLMAIQIGFGQSTAFKIKGSDTCLPLIQAESENYMKKNSNASITVVGGGSGVGIAALIAGQTDIAMASRKLKMDEKLKLQDGGKGFKEVVFAQDALSVVVNNNNKVSQLNREQLEGIFTGKIKNWKEVGGEDMVIVVYSRETSSGTYEFFKEHVMKSKNFASTVLSMPATGAIIQSVSQTKGAIGYVGLAYVDKTVKALKVSFDGKTYVEPSVENAKTKKYPITRPLQLYYLSSSEKTVAPYVQYILSDEGQKTVAVVGYIPLK
jgi:phosphate transport system substrate-binding protein